MKKLKTFKLDSLRRNEMRRITGGFDPDLLGGSGIGGSYVINNGCICYCIYRTPFGSEAEFVPCNSSCSGGTDPLIAGC